MVGAGNEWHPTRQKHVWNDLVNERLALVVLKSKPNRPSFVTYRLLYREIYIEDASNVEKETRIKTSWSLIPVVIVDLSTT
jgi:hypothetical protein